MPTLICAPIMVQDAASALRDAQSARDLGADLVEFRLDEVFSGGGDEAEIRTILRLIADSPLPCIATCRPTSEGGHYDGPDDARISLFERLGTAFGPGERPPRFLDVELSTLQRSANIRQKVRLAVEHPEQVRDLSTSLIVSMHDFHGRPPDLTRRLLSMRAEPAAKVLKIAYRARSLRDNLELFDLLAERDRPTIALGMGEFGLMSRILAPKIGGFLTFASLRPQSATAPGQPAISELLSLYRFRRISPASAVYGVVGWPVAQSLSPLIHNAGFEAVNHDGVYLPLPIPEGHESLKATLLELIHHPRLTLRGVSITHPHKETILRLARDSGWSIDDTADRIGAANTLVVDGDQIRILNTDITGLEQALAPELDKAPARRATILGAGGAARAAAFALASRGLALTLAGRTHQHATQLAEQLRPRLGQIETVPWESAASAPCDVLINCTPVGMSAGPAPDRSPIDLDLLSQHSPHALIVDTVYSPLRTPLLKSALASGFRTLDGVPMFVHQAAAQFRAWTGRAAPLGLFERLVRESAGNSGPSA